MKMELVMPPIIGLKVPNVFFAGNVVCYFDIDVAEC